MSKRNGIEDVDKAIKEVEGYTEEQIEAMGKVIKKYGSKVRKEARTTAPHHRGTLIKNINVKGYHKTNGQFLHRVVGPKNRRTAAPFIVNGTEQRYSRYNFGRKLLFGAKMSLGKVGANRFMQEARSQHDQQFQNDMKKVIEKDKEI